MNGQEASKLIASLEGDRKDFAIRFKRIIENVLEELRDKNLLKLEFAERHSNFLNILEDHSIRFPRAYNMLWEIFGEKGKSMEFVKHNKEFGINEKDLPYLLLSQAIYAFTTTVELFKNCFLIILKKEKGFKERMTLTPFLCALARSTKDGQKIREVIDVDLRNALSHSLFWIERENVCYYKDMSLKKLCKVSLKDFVDHVKNHNIVCQLLIRTIPQMLLSERSS